MCSPSHERFEDSSVCSSKSGYSKKSIISPINCFFVISTCSCTHLVQLNCINVHSPWIATVQVGTWMNYIQCDRVYRALVIKSNCTVDCKVCDRFFSLRMWFLWTGHKILYRRSTVLPFGYRTCFEIDERWRTKNSIGLWDCQKSNGNCHGGGELTFDAKFVR